MKRWKKWFVAALAVLALLALAVPAYAEESTPWWDAFGWFKEIANFIKALVVPPENY